MRVCILGAGSIAFGMAAYLAEAGQRADPVVAVRQPHTGARGGRAAEGDRRARLRGAGQRRLDLRPGGRRRRRGAAARHARLRPSRGVDAVAPHIRPGPAGDRQLAQLLRRALSVAPARRARRRGADLVWGTTVSPAAAEGRVRCRQHRPAEGRRRHAAREPASARGGAVHALFGDRFVPRDGLLAIALPTSTRRTISASRCST